MPKTPPKKIQTKKQSERNRVKNIFFILLFLGLCVGIVFVINSNYLRINLADINGESIVSENAIKEEIQRYLAQKKYYTLNNNSRIVFDEDVLRERLVEHFPRIARIDIQIENGELSLIVEEHASSSIICFVEDNAIVYSGDCFAIDEQGTLVDKSPYVAHNLTQVIRVKKNSQESVPELGASVDDIVFGYIDMQMFIHAIEEEFKLDISYSEVTENHDIKLYMSYVEDVYFSIQDEQPFIILSPDMGYDTVQKNLSFVFTSESFEELFDTRPQDLESIDVRFEGRVSHTFTPLENY